MKPLTFLVLTTIVWSTGCIAQSSNHKKRVGGDCENCELMYLGMPKEIMSDDTSSGWHETGQKLVISGRIFKPDGKTAAKNVILYYYHTDNKGYYTKKEDKPENQTPHGYLRGWVKTDKNGRYTIHTIRPAPYPNGNTPSHIHIIIKEPELKHEYWIDDFVFDDDKLHIEERKRYPERNPRGGSGILHVVTKDRLQTAEHNIILGLNVPDYPGKK